MFEQKVTSLGSDLFLNCSVDYGTEPDNITVWTLDDELLWINETWKYNVNTTGLTVYNVTAEDEGNYTCHVHQLTANIFLNVVCKLIFTYSYIIFMRVHIDTYSIYFCRATKIIV